MPRLFFAVETPRILKPELIKLQDEMAEDFRQMIPAPNAKPEHLAQSHCTIRFLGYVEESKVERIIAEVGWAIAAAGISPFECKLTKCGVFPNPRHARVFWIGLSPEEPFQQIQRAIDVGLTAAGIHFETEHSLHPHLTLFRFREPYRLPIDFEFLDRRKDSPIRVISDVLLIESKTLDTGAVHTVRAIFPLGSEP